MWIVPNGAHGEWLSVVAKYKLVMGRFWFKRIVNHFSSAIFVQKIVIVFTAEKTYSSPGITLKTVSLQHIKYPFVPDVTFPISGFTL